MPSAPHETVAPPFPFVRAVGGLGAGAGIRQIATALARGALHGRAAPARDRTRPALHLCDHESSKALCRLRRGLSLVLLLARRHRDGPVAESKCHADGPRTRVAVAAPESFGPAGR